MDPREIFKKVKKLEEKVEYAFALEVGSGLVKGAIWAIEAGKAKTLAVSQGIGWQEEGKLVEAADRAFSEAVEKASITEEEEPQKIIFGLPFSWVKGEKIIPAKLGVLKELCQRLDLKPVGFVVTAEAIVKYLRTLEGVAPSAILVNVGVREIGVSLLRLGKIKGNSLVKKSPNLGEDIAEGLSRIKSDDVLPARMILYDSQANLEDKKEEILDYPWLKGETKFNFLHLPKTEIMGTDFDIKAVALAGGAEVAKAQGIEAEIVFAKEDREKKEELEKEKDQPELVAVKAEEGEPKKDKEKTAELGFGFVKGKDIAKEEKEKKGPELELAVPTVAAPLSTEKKPSKKRFAFRLPKIKIHVLGKIFSVIKLPQRLPFVGMVLAVLLLIGLGGLVYLWWFYPKAEVTLFVKPEVIEKEFAITLDSTVSNADANKMVIPAQKVEVVVSGQKEVSTTGVKLIGEEAKGEVIVYNRTVEEKSLDAGTAIAGPDDLQFLLDEEVIVASESAGPDYSRIPGKAAVKVTAAEIGSESNLAADSEFSVGKYSQTDLVARNETAFSGGSSREIQAVSQDDYDRLYSETLEDLQSQAQGKLQEKVASGGKIVSESVSEEVTAKDYSRELEEEADLLVLDLTIEFKALAYREAELNDLVREKIKSSVSAGFEYREDDSEVSFQLDEVVSDEEALFTAFFKASLWPLVDTEQIQEVLRGKKPELGKFYLEGLTSLAGYEVSFLPELPAKIRTFPKVAKNIRIEVRSE